MEAKSTLKPVFICLDDEKIILGSLQSQLQRNFGPEYQYEFAESAMEAFELIDEMSVDEMSIILIISDWLMPEMKGDEFLIKVHEEHPQIIKIMLTGHADPNAIQRAVDEADLFKCLIKPWTEEELITTIKNALKKIENSKII